MNPMQNKSRWARRIAGALALVLVVLALPLVAADIPDRPEKLQYPALRYAPPEASQVRVKLAGGIPAYLVPDHTLPLVNVVVLMRIGPDLDPVGKEGLAGTM